MSELLRRRAALLLPAALALAASPGRRRAQAAPAAIRCPSMVARSSGCAVLPVTRTWPEASTLAARCLRVSGF